MPSFSQFGRNTRSISHKNGSRSDQPLSGHQSRSKTRERSPNRHVEQLRGLSPRVPLGRSPFYSQHDTRPIHDSNNRGGMQPFRGRESTRREADISGSPRNLSGERFGFSHRRTTGGISPPRIDRRNDLPFSGRHVRDASPARAARREIGPQFGFVASRDDGNISPRRDNRRDDRVYIQSDRRLESRGRNLSPEGICRRGDGVAGFRQDTRSRRGPSPVPMSNRYDKFGFGEPSSRTRDRSPGVFSSRSELHGGVRAIDDNQRRNFTESAHYDTRHYQDSGRRSPQPSSSSRFLNNRPQTTNRPDFGFSNDRGYESSFERGDSKRMTFDRSRSPIPDRRDARYSGGHHSPSPMRMVSGRPGIRYDDRRTDSYVDVSRNGHVTSSSSFSRADNRYRDEQPSRNDYPLRVSGENTHVRHYDRSNQRDDIDYENDRRAPIGQRRSGSPTTASRRPNDDFNSRRNPKPCNTIGVFSMNYITTKEDLTELFSRFGRISNVSLVTGPDGRSRGFAFVTYARLSDAYAAKDSMNNQKLHGRILRVDFSSTGGPVPDKTRDDDLPRYEAGRSEDMPFRVNRDGRNFGQRDGVAFKRNRSRSPPSASFGSSAGRSNTAGGHFGSHVRGPIASRRAFDQRSPDRQSGQPNIGRRQSNEFGSNRGHVTSRLGHISSGRNRDSRSNSGRHEVGNKTGTTNVDTSPESTPDRKSSSPSPAKTSGFTLKSRLGTSHIRGSKQSDVGEKRDRSSSTDDVSIVSSSSASGPKHISRRQIS